MFNFKSIVCLSFFLLFPRVAGAQSDAYRHAMAQFEVAKKSGNHEQGEQWIQEALKYGSGDEYAWRSLSWCQARQGKWRASIMNAEENIRRNGQTAWSLVQLYDANLSAGEYRTAGQTLEVAGNLNDWQGIDLRRYYSEYLDRISTRTYELEIEILPKAHQKQGTLQFLIPMNCERQQFTDRTVAGAESFRFFSKEDKEFLEVKQIGRAHV